MKITEHTERDDNEKTFYSLDVGDVFMITDKDFLNNNSFPNEKFFYKTNGTIATNSGNAVCLDDGRLKGFNGGMSCYKVDAELIIHNKE